MTKSTGSIVMLVSLLLNTTCALAQNGNSDTALDSYRPIDDQMLMNPPGDDWLMWRNSYDLSGHSTLQHINKENVQGLKETWRIPLSQGSNMTTPLVHDGVMFIADTNNTLLALDASNGLELWRYQHESEVFDGRR